MAIHWFRSVGFCLWMFTWCYCSAPVFIKQQAVCLDAGLCSVTTSSSAAVVPVFMSGKVHACGWGLGNTGPLGNHAHWSSEQISTVTAKPQRTVSCCEIQVHAICFLFAFLGMPEGSPSDAKPHKPLCAHTDRPSAKQDPPNTLALSTLLYQRTVQTSSSRWTASLWHNHFQTAMPWCKTGPLDPCPLHCTWFHIRTSAEFISVTWNNRQTKWKISERDRNKLCLTSVHYSTYWLGFN